MYLFNLFQFAILAVCSFEVSANLWCYSCVSSQPGCNEHEVNWFIHHAITCPRADDKCVKIIERKGAEVQVTRDCLSNLVGFKRDIPADRFEGCRPAAAQPKLATYVSNSVNELDLKREFWDEVTYCFCEFDEWCNSSNSIKISIATIITSLLLTQFLWRRY